MINSFLLRLPTPVCLVAHNGDNFDFPLLKAELEKVNGSLGTDILCADPYNGFKHIFKTRQDKIDCDKQAVEEKIVDIELKAVSELLAAGEFEAEMDTPPETQVTPMKRSGEELVNYYKISKIENESTPSKYKVLDDPSKLKQVQISSMLKSRKKLKFDHNSIPPSYSLLNLHKNLLGEAPSQSHGAEAECMALLRTTAMMGRDWVDWVENNCYVFMDCEKMWSA